MAHDSDHTVAPVSQVIAFPGGPAKTVDWQILSIRNATQAASLALSVVLPAAEQVIEAGRAEARLASAAAELSGILNQLVQDVGALRHYYF